MKKLVFCSNSIQRMNFMDNYMFTDSFDGEIYIVTDDRIKNQKNDYLNQQKAWKNPNLKKAKILALCEDGLYDYCMNQLDLSKINKEYLGKLIFFIGGYLKLYFVRSSEDSMMLSEDDIVLFKNPDILDWNKLQALRYVDLRASMLGDKKGVFNYFRTIQDEKYSKFPDPESCYKQYIEDGNKTAFSSLALYIYTYDEKLPDIIKRHVESSNFQKAVLKNSRLGNKLFKQGVSTSEEKFWSLYYTSRGCKDIDGCIIQQGKNEIFRAKKFLTDDIFAYHYTVIQDKHVFELFPVLKNEGYEKYREKLENFKIDELEGKFVYMDVKVFGKEDSCKSVNALREAKQKTKEKIGLFGLNKLEK